MAVDGVGSLWQDDQDVGDIGVVGEGSVVPYAGVERDESSLRDMEDFNSVQRDLIDWGSRSDVDENVGVEGQDSFAGAVMKLGYVDDGRALANAAGGK